MCQTKNLSLIFSGKTLHSGAAVLAVSVPRRCVHSSSPVHSSHRAGRQSVDLF